jgi:multicomponent K+:H+ antiporter subunit G
MPVFGENGGMSLFLAVLTPFLGAALVAWASRRGRAYAARSAVAVFTFIGSRGLYHLRDGYTRLHGPTKATTLGVGCLLVASSIVFSVTGEALSLHEILVSLFLFITAPVSAHLLAKAALHRELPSLTVMQTNDRETKSGHSA